MANKLPDNAFTSRRALDPGLHRVARFLPRGGALHRGVKFPRAVFNFAGNAARIRGIPVAAVNEHVTVRLHRPAGLPDRAPALLWIHGGGNVMGTAVQDDRYCRKLSHLAGVAIAAAEHRLAPSIPIRPRSKTAMRRYSGWHGNHGWTRRDSPSAEQVPVGISRRRWHS
jgi:acetyl esterase/lipase